ncbi:MAG: hypothetical protein AAFU79_25870 [Myxococcota bacterium]
MKLAVRYARMVVSTPDAFRMLASALDGGAEISARWKTTSDVGPGWSGSGRSVSLEGFEAPPEVLAAIEAALVRFFGLPPTSPDLYWSGDGVIEREGDLLVVDYEYSCGVPYDQPVFYDIDAQPLFDLGTGAELEPKRKPWADVGCKPDEA